jgi:hypothetical protein
LARRSHPHYEGEITYRSIEIRNRAPNEMREQVNALPFTGYHVETLTDGRKVCITKPGGKQFWGNVKPNDFMVWIYDEARRDRWRISHAEIYEDLRQKLGHDHGQASLFVDRMREVCEGAEPGQMVSDGLLKQFAKLPGMSAELILKAYKWIWAQEDCNYPTGEGRWKSMNAILDLRGEMAPKAPPKT